MLIIGWNESNLVITKVGSTIKPRYAPINAKLKSSIPESAKTIRESNITLLLEVSIMENNFLNFEINDCTLPIKLTLLIKNLF